MCTTSHHRLYMLALLAQDPGVSWGAILDERCALIHGALLRAPQVEATKFTEVGFHGRDVDQIIRDLVDSAITLTRSKLRRASTASIAAAVEDKIVDALCGPACAVSTKVSGSAAPAAKALPLCSVRLRKRLLPCRDTEFGHLQKSSRSNVIGSVGSIFVCGLCAGWSAGGSGQSVLLAPAHSASVPLFASPLPCLALQESFRKLYREGALENNNVDIDVPTHPGGGHVFAGNEQNVRPGAPLRTLPPPPHGCPLAWSQRWLLQLAAPARGWQQSVRGRIAAFLATAPRPKDRATADVTCMQMREIFVDLTKMMNKGKTEKRTMKVFPLSRLLLIFLLPKLPFVLTSSCCCCSCCCVQTVRA